MIKERPTNMARVVLAFVATALVALLPIAIVGLTSIGVADAMDAIAGYRGPALWIGVSVIVIAATASVVSSVLRRKPRAARV